MKFLFALAISLFSLVAAAQEDTTELPYKRFPTLPPFQLLMGDSTSKYTKDNVPAKKPVLLLLFSPECSHCQHTAEEIYQHKDDFKNIQIIMATLHSLTQMNEFMQTYKLNEMPNIVAGKDIYYILPPFYGISSLPYMAFYNKSGKLITGFEGSMPVERVLQIFKANN